MKKPRNRLKVAIVVICVSCFLLLLSIKVINGFMDVSESLENSVPKTFSMVSEDSTIISKSYLKRFKVDEIDNFKQREPVSVLLLDSRYYLIIARANLKRQASAKDIIHENTESVDQTTDEVYSILDLRNSFQFKCLSSPIDPVSNIYLTFSGDSLIAKWSDSIARFHILAADLSIRFAEHAPIDIYATGKELLLGMKEKRSVDLLVLIRGCRVYFLLMVPINSESKIPPDLLYDVIGGH